jgi:hypothetical protein
MLFALIPIVWLTVIALCWAACAMAQRADAEQRPSASHGASDAGLVIWEGLPELTARDAGLTAPGIR